MRPCEFPQLTIGRKETGSARVLKVNNDYRELVFRLRTDRLALELGRVINDELTSHSLWCKSQPFMSFAPVRSHQSARWLVDGADYFGAVADALEAAKHTIYIAGWWISPEVCPYQRAPQNRTLERTGAMRRSPSGPAPAPPMRARPGGLFPRACLSRAHAAQIYLKRPVPMHPDMRLDRLLARKATQGVRVFVMLYKEVPTTLPNESFYTKQALKRSVRARGRGCPRGAHVV